MSHRSIATIQRPKPHRYWEDKDAPGTCRRCHLLKRNGVHDPAAAAEQEKADRRAELEAELAANYVDAEAARRIREEADGGAHLLTEYYRRGRYAPDTNEIEEIA